MGNWGERAWTPSFVRRVVSYVSAVHVCHDLRKKTWGRWKREREEDGCRAGRTELACSWSGKSEKMIKAMETIGIMSIVHHNFADVMIISKKITCWTNIALEKSFLSRLLVLKVCQAHYCAQKRGNNKLGSNERGEGIHFPLLQEKKPFFSSTRQMQ